MTGRNRGRVVEAHVPRRRAAVKVEVPISPALYPHAEREAARVGLGLAQWVGEVVEVRLAELARAAADRSGVETG